LTAVAGAQAQKGNAGVRPRRVSPAKIAPPNAAAANSANATNRANATNTTRATNATNATSSVSNRANVDNAANLVDPTDVTESLTDNDSGNNQTNELNSKELPAKVATLFAADPRQGPPIRIALVSDVATAQITCDQPLIYFDPTTAQLTTLASNQLKVQLDREEVDEPVGRRYRVQVTSLRSSKEARQIAEQLRQQFQAPVEVQIESRTGRYQVLAGDFGSSKIAQSFMVQVMNAGYRKVGVAKYDADRANGQSSRIIRVIQLAPAANSAPKNLGTKLNSPDTPYTSADMTNWDGAGFSDPNVPLTFRDRLVVTSPDPEKAPLRVNGSTYRGRLEIFVNRRDRLTLINVLPMEEYLRGVVPNELSPGGFPQLEALKAQAVAARTYAVRNMGQFAMEGFDLLPTALSQVYGGKSTEHPLSDRAVAETAGIVATYDNQPINALYTSTCGGRTEASEYVFSEAVPYLVSVACAADPELLVAANGPTANLNSINDGLSTSINNAGKLTANNLKTNSSLKTNNPSADNLNINNLNTSNGLNTSNSLNTSNLDSNDPANNRLAIKFSLPLIKTDRVPRVIVDVNGRNLTSMLATLDVLGFPGLTLSAEEIVQEAPEKDIQRWLSHLATLFKRPLPATASRQDITRLPGLASVLTSIIYGDQRPSNLLAPQDAEYLLAADAAAIPVRQRSEVAALLQEGLLLPAPDGSLHPDDLLTRSQVIACLARAVMKTGKLALETGSLRPAEGRRIKIRNANNKNKDFVDWELAPDYYLFRSLQSELFPVTQLTIVGGEKVNYHVNSKGQIDYLEVQPHPNGTAGDRFSVYSRWQVTLTLAEVRARLQEARIDVGEIRDLQPLTYGHSHRVAALKVLGSQGEKVITGLRIRSALGLRETLFIIQRDYDPTGQLRRFEFQGRGWGHGVGLCQVGAYGLALQGLDYQQILQTYYRNITLATQY
jgi:SpoIID/LytB domain protein